MAKRLQHLKPGDLITADFMNAIVDALNSLEARLSAIEKRLAKVRAGERPRKPAKRTRKA